MLVQIFKIRRDTLLNNTIFITGLVTQTGFVEYLSEEHALILEKMNITVGEMNLPETVHTVQLEGTSALDALKKMRDMVIQIFI